LLDFQNIGPRRGRITHEQLEFVKRLWWDTAAIPGHLPDVAALVAHLGDLPHRVVLKHLNLKFSRYQEVHLDRWDFCLCWDIERIGLPFVWDTLARIQIAVAPRGRRQAHDETPYNTQDHGSPLPTGRMHQLSLLLSPPIPSRQCLQA